MGLNTREIVQFDAGATGTVQLLVKLKSEGLAPARETEEMCSGPVPVLMTIRVCDGLDVPSSVPGKESAVGEKAMAGWGATPVPLRTSVCGVPGALSATCRFAVKVPALDGVKVILTAQLAFGARVAWQVFV